jgi:hypothetical protein
MYAVVYAEDGRTHTHTHTDKHTVCCNVSEKEYSSLLGVSFLTKYFYEVKHKLIYEYVMETIGYVVGSNKLSNLKEKETSDDTPRVGDSW